MTYTSIHVKTKIQSSDNIIQNRFLRFIMSFNITTFIGLRISCHCCYLFNVSSLSEINDLRFSFKVVNGNINMFVLNWYDYSIVTSLSVKLDRPIYFMCFHEKTIFYLLASPIDRILSLAIMKRFI